ncbi:trypsin-like serine protease [Ruminococcus sp.]|uniref:trypsin-like serine peptidase n=1 Tax=Ruminococcus sp. TaxID=41978 RepID=UPI0025E88088|nr:trypsin-like serine protease [Ruminococcus sp.]
MTKKIIIKVVSTIIALVLTISSLTFASVLPSSALNRTVHYLRYDCTSKSITNYTLNQLSEYASNSRTIFPDNRKPDTDQSVVYLSSGGSGFIVDDHCIATAAHCVYDYVNNCFIDNIDVIICNSNKNNPILTCDAVALHIPLMFRSYRNNEPIRSCYDYALIYVEEDLSQYGIFELGVPTNAFLSNNSAIVTSGFPGYINVDQGANGQRYYSTGSMQTFNITNDIQLYPEAADLRFYSTCINSAGDSGGPAYAITTLQNTEYRTIVGIVTGAGTKIENNVEGYWGTYGVRMTTDLLHFYLNNSYI